MPEKDISQVWIDRIKVKHGREVYYDTTQRGLALRVSHTGKKVWQVSYRMPGSRTKQVFDLGQYSKTYLSIAEARKRAKELLEGVQHGIDPKAKPKKTEETATPLTLNKLTKEYIERYAKAKGKKTWDRDQELLERNVLKRLGNRPANEIRKREFIELLEEVARKGTKGKGAPIAANRTLAVLKTMYKWANRVEVLETYDPVRDIPKIAPENVRDRVLSDDEIKRLWEAFDGKDENGKRIISPLMADLFRMRLITAQRGGEIEKMRWQDIAGAWWTIPKEHTKNGKAHRVPLTPLALEIINRQPRSLERKGKPPIECASVFTNSKTARPITTGQKAADCLTNATGISFVLHDFRRTAASIMASLDIDPKTIGRLLNHTEPGVTEVVYIQYRYDKEKRQALEAWERQLKAIIG